MKLSGNIIKSLLLTLAAGLIAASCIKDNIPIEYPEAMTLQMSVGTKATATDGSLEGTEGTLNTIRVYAFVGGEPIGHYFGSASTFYMDVKVYESYQNNKQIPIDFYVIANEAGALNGGEALSLSASTTEDELNSLSFTQLFPENGLLMFGKETKSINMMADAGTNTAEGHKDHTIIAEKVSLNLRRPFGKLGVFAASTEETTSTLTINKLEILENGTVFRNYVMPQTDLANSLNFGAEGVNLNQGVKYAVTATISADASDEVKQNSANFTPVLKEPYYPFENPYGSTPENWATKTHDNGNVLKITYQFEGKQEQEGLVYLPPINRNEYIMVNCIFNNAGKLTIHYTVADWDEVEWTGIKFEYPSYESLALPSGNRPSTNDIPQCWFTGSDEGAFLASFKMTSPALQTWTPTLTNATAEDFELTVYRSNDTSKTPLTADQLIASETPYIIQVKPLKSITTEKTVDLAITFRPSWDQDDIDLLYINGSPGDGSTDDVIWTGGGTNCRYLTITQLVKAPATGN